MDFIQELIAKILKFREYVEYIRWVNITFGLIGNTLMFVVFFQPKLRKLSVSTYFRAMSIVYLLVNLNWIRSFVGGNFLSSMSSFSCKSISFLVYILAPTSTWLEVAAGFDRFLTITHSAHFKFIQNNWFQLIVVSAIIISNLSVYSPVLFSYNLSEDHQCENNNEKLIGNIDFINLAVLPFMLNVFASVSLFVSVMRSRKHVKRSSFLGKSRSRSQTRDIKFGVTLLFINLVFFILNGPIHLSYFLDINPFSERKPFERIVFYHIIVVLSEIQFSACFYLQLAVNSLLRDEFKGMFRKIWRTLSSRCFSQ